MARLADEAGYDAVWVGDSVVAKPRLEPLTTLAYLAAITTRCAWARPCCCQRSAIRSCWPADRQRRSVSRGRVVLGLGVGWSLPSAEREWAACGADHKRRVRRLEEHVEIWRKLWRGEPVSQRGRGLRADRSHDRPAAVEEAGPPVLITAGNRGELLPAQLDRFARLGDGIITTYVHAEECRRAGRAPRRRGRGAGAPRGVSAVRLHDGPHGGRSRRSPSVSPPSFSPPTTAAACTRAARWAWAGASCHRALRRYAEAGVTDLCLRFVGDDQLAQLERFTREVLPALRES